MPQTHNDALCPIRRRGKRTLTPAMLQARDELLDPPPAYPEKYAVLNTLRALPRSFPLTRTARGLLERMVEKTRPESWDALETPFIYAHNATLMGWTGLSLSALRRAVRELAEAGMLVPATDGTGRGDGAGRGRMGCRRLGSVWPRCATGGQRYRQNWNPADGSARKSRFCVTLLQI